MKLSKLQEKIVNAPEDKIIILASAASGKTVTLTERVRKLLRDGESPSDIACITFTNLAAQEMKSRLKEDYKDGMYIGTIHGLANKFLVSYGINTEKLIEEQDFDKFFVLIKKNPACVKHIRYILLDEAQDTSQDEYDFIFNMIEPIKFFIVGDLRQSIYSFKNADPKILENLCNDPEVKVYSLNENYRNGSNILNFARNILKKGHMTDDSIPMNIGGKVYRTDLDLNNLIGWVKNQDNYGDWAILCRTNAEISLIQKELDNNNIPNITFKQGQTDKEKLDELMNTNAVKVLTRHSAKGLEFENVIVWAAVWWGGPEMYRVNYVAATRAKKILVWMEEKYKPRKKYF